MSIYSLSTENWQQIGPGLSDTKTFQSSLDRTTQFLQDIEAAFIAFCVDQKWGKTNIDSHLITFIHVWLSSFHKIDLSIR